MEQYPILTTDGPLKHSLSELEYSDYDEAAEALLTVDRPDQRRRVYLTERIFGWYRADTNRCGLGVDVPDSLEVEINNEEATSAKSVSSTLLVGTDRLRRLSNIDSTEL